MKLIYSIFVTLILLFVVTFSLHNINPVDLKYFDFVKFTVPVYLLIFISFGAGLILAGFLDIVVRQRLSRAVVKLNRKIDELEKKQAELEKDKKKLENENLQLQQEQFRPVEQYSAKEPEVLPVGEGEEKEPV